MSDNLPDIVEGEVVVPIPRSPVIAPRRSVAVATGVWRFVSPEPVEHHLSDNEWVLIATRLHWFVPLKLFGMSMLSMPVAILLMFVLGWLFPGVFLVQAILLASALAHQAYLVYLIIAWRMDQVILTNKRLMRARGVFTRTVDAINLRLATRAQHHRSLLGRLFGYGFLHVDTAGVYEGLERIDMLPYSSSIFRALPNE